MENGKVDREKLAADMQYLRGIYGWNDGDVAEIRAAAKEAPAWWDYWKRLAATHRAGSPVLLEAAA
jgi:hypothetical protein